MTNVYVIVQIDNDEEYPTVAVSATSDYQNAQDQAYDLSRHNDFEYQIYACTLDMMDFVERWNNGKVEC